MIKAVWNDVVIAQTENYETVEGNRYFPPESLHMEYFRPSSTHTVCFWKGKASYYDIIANGQVNPDAAWYYPATAPAAFLRELQQCNLSCLCWFGSLLQYPVRGTGLSPFL